MFYPNTMVGTFLSRPNRFLAHVMLDGREVVCHVKNTGRLKELLIPGASVVVQHHPDAAVLGRKTEYSLIKVAKPIDMLKQDSESSCVWVNIDSQAPNQVAFEWLSLREIDSFVCFKFSNTSFFKSFLHFFRN